MPQPSAESWRTDAERSAPVVILMGAAVAIVLVVALAVPLSAVGWWSPWIGWAAALVGATLTGRWVLRSEIRRNEIRFESRTAARTLLIIAAASFIWMALTATEQTLPRRDAGSNLQAAVSLASTGARQITVTADSIAAPESLLIPGVTLSAPAFYQAGTLAAPEVEPQFPIGPAAYYSLGYPFGWRAMVMLAPFAMAVSLLGVGVLTARTIGDRWAPLAAGLCALVFPLVHVGRSTLSEPVSEVTLLAGVTALVIAAEQRHRGWAVLGGALIGSTLLIRIDALREIALVVVVLSGFMATRHRWAGYALSGMLAATVIGIGANQWSSAQYLTANASSWRAALALLAGTVLLGATAVAFARAGWLRPVRSAAAWRWWPVVAPAVVVVVGLVLASRPLWLTVRENLGPGINAYIGVLQAGQGLPVDPGRTYAEQSVTWLSWWLGPIALVIALVALASVTRVLVERWQQLAPTPPWAIPLLVGAGSTVLIVLRPGITPDHPWADRRLVLALPFLVILVVVAAAWASRLTAAQPVVGSVVRRWPWLPRVAPAAVLISAAIPAGVVSAAHGAERIEHRTAGAIEQVCAGLSDKDVVLAVDDRAANEWPQVVRGWCGRPALALTAPTRADPAQRASAVAALAPLINSRGGRLILLAADSDSALTELNATETQLVADVDSTQDQRLLTRLPWSHDQLPVQVWLGRPSSS